MKLFLLSLMLALVCQSIIGKSLRQRKRERQKSQLKPVGPKIVRLSGPMKTKVRYSVKKSKKQIWQGSLQEIAGAGVLSPEDKRKQNKKMRKSDYYVDPRVLDQLRDVNSIEDFVRVFKPKGFTIKKERVFVKKSPSISRGGSTVGRPGVPGISSGAPGFHKTGSKSHSGSVGEKDVVEKEMTFVYDDQGKKVSDPVQDVKVSSNCEPRHQPFSVFGPEILAFPNCVMRRQCGGCCKFRQQCVADTTENTTLRIFVRKGGNFVTEYHQIVHHKTCKCECIVKPSDCRTTQVYSQRNCQCECPSSSQKDCSADGKKWSHIDCDCVCSNKRTCKSRLKKWDKKNCRCGCIDTPCRSGKVRDKKTCRCVSPFLSDTRYDQPSSGRIDLGFPFHDKTHQDEKEETGDDDPDETDDDYFGDF